MKRKKNYSLHVNLLWFKSYGSSYNVKEEKREKYRKALQNIWLYDLQTTLPDKLGIICNLIRINVGEIENEIN